MATYSSHSCIDKTVKIAQLIWIPMIVCLIAFLSNTFLLTPMNGGKPVSGAFIGQYTLSFLIGCLFIIALGLIMALVVSFINWFCDKDLDIMDTVMEVLIAACSLPVFLAENTNFWEHVFKRVIQFDN